jgi:hypothetical protein
MDKSRQGPNILIIDKQRVVRPLVYNYVKRFFIKLFAFVVFEILQVSQAQCMPAVGFPL